MHRLFFIFVAVLNTCSVVPMYGQPNEEIDVARTIAIEAVDAEVGESTDADIVEVANAAKQEIANSSNETKIVEIKDLAIYKITTIKDFNSNIGDRTYILFRNIVIGDRMNLFKHAQNQNDANAIRKEIWDRLELSVWVYDSAKAETLGMMSQPCTDCTAVEVSDGTTTVTMYNPSVVKYLRLVE